MIFALKIWNHYLYGVHLDVFTNHKSLHDVFSQINLNLRQRSWLKLLKEYNVSVLFQLGKANIVIDELSRVSMESMDHVEDGKRESVKDVHRLGYLGVRVSGSNEGGLYMKHGLNHHW